MPTTRQRGGLDMCKPGKRPFVGLCVVAFAGLVNGCDTLPHNRPPMATAIYGLSASTDRTYVAHYHFADTTLAVPNDFLRFRWPAGYQPFDRRVCARKAPPLSKAEQESCAEPDQQVIDLLVTLPDLSPYRAFGRSDFLNIEVGYNEPEFGDDAQAELADSHGDHVERTRVPDLDTKLYTAFQETWTRDYVTKKNPDFPRGLLPAYIEYVRKYAAQFDYVSNSGAPPRRAICYRYSDDSPIRCTARFKVQTPASPYSLDFLFSIGQLDRLPAVAPLAASIVAGFRVKQPLAAEGVRHEP